MCLRGSYHYYQSAEGVVHLYFIKNVSSTPEKGPD
jgi:hypothetical protein